MTPRNEHCRLEALLAETEWVLALARRLVHDPADAEDIAQSTLALAIEKRPEARSGLRPWLTKVAGRLAHRRVRSNVRRQAREALVSSVRDANASASDEVAMRFELQRDVAKKVDALSEPYRRVLVLRYFKGLSVSEIATVTMAPPSTVRSQLSRAIDRLRSDFRQNDDQRRALGLLLAAAAPSSKLTLNKTAEILLLKVSTKVAAVAAAAIVAGVFILMSSDDRDDVIASNSQGLVASNNDVGEARRNANALVDQTKNDEEEVALASEVSREETDAVSPIPADHKVLTTTILRARILGSGSLPLVGATVSSIYPDGKPRGLNTVSKSDHEGRVVLELSDDALRKTRTQTLDMLFAVSADDHATRFVIKKPKRHRVNDLGDVHLSLGGTFSGTCVDEEGNPIAGAVLYASDSITTGDPTILSVHGPGTGGAMPRTMSREDGRFELAGISSDIDSDGVAAASLWAHAYGCLWTTLGPIQVKPAKRTDVGSVVLVRAQASQRVDGTVYQPDGSPAVGARVDYLTASRPPHGQVVTDGSGRFIVIVKDDVPLEFVARDAKNAFGMSASLKAQRGESIALHLTTRRLMSVIALDTEGKPIRDVNIMPVLNSAITDVDQDTRLVPGERWAHTDENGRVDFVIPDQRFSVAARNTDHSSKTLGPFTQDTAPSVLNITMPRGGAMSGRVLAYGKPVAGATVAVTRRHMSFAAMTGGFPNRYPSGTHKYTTDAEGRFKAPLKKNWSSVGVVARAEGLASGEVSFEINPGDDIRDVEVHLTQGGIIEGRVTPPAGVDVATLHVAASRGDGHPISTFVDAKGRFRFERLAPGDWRVEGRTQEVRKEMLSISRHPLDLNPRWNAFVLDGKTLKVDIDMSNLGDVQLEGELLIDGRGPLPGWTVEVLRPPHERGPTKEKAHSIGQGGVFAFTTKYGRALLRLAGPLREGGRAQLLREVHLQGPRLKWRTSLSTAVVSESIDGGAQQARFVRGEDDEVDGDLTMVPVDASGNLKARVLIGRSRLQTRPLGSKSKNDWSSLKIIDVY